MATEQSATETTVALTPGRQDSIQDSASAHVRDDDPDGGRRGARENIAANPWPRPPVPEELADTSVAARNDELDDQPPSTVEMGPGTPRFRLVDVGATLGRYELIEELGAGGMATVYLARDRGLRRDVAIKVLFPHLCKRREIVMRFQREARAAAGLDHRHIVRVYDVGGGPGDGPPDSESTGARESGDDRERCDPPYIVMELVRGVSLDEFLREHLREHGLPLAEVVASIGAIMCSALAEAHRAGIVHRDIKPSNIMIAEGGRLALADFGVARLDDDDASVVTRSGALVGTPAFMSPEQALGNPLDVRSDIYSLGATLYKLATGAVPHGGSTARVVAAIARGDEYKPPLMRNPALGRDFDRVVGRMMAHDREERHDSCDAVAEALRSLVAAAGLDEPERELARFFADPPGYAAGRVEIITTATLERARVAAEDRNPPRAIALADRVLALEPDSPRADEALALIQHLGTGRRLGRWFFAAALAVVVVIAGYVIVRQWTGVELLALDGSADAGVAERATDGDASVASVDEHARLDIADPLDSGPDDSPIRTTADGSPDVIATGPGGDRDVTPGHPGTRRRDPGRRSAPASGTSNGASGGRRSDPDGDHPDGDRPGAGPVDAGPSPGSVPGSIAPPDAAPAQATIKLVIRPWCDVFIDGHAHGRAQRDRVISLAPGSHDIVCTQGSGRSEWRRRVTLRPGQHRTFEGSVLTPVRIRVAIGARRHLVIDGERHDNGDSLQLLPGRYRILVIASGETVAGDWVSIPAIAACTLRDQPALDCYR